MRVLITKILGMYASIRKFHKCLHYNAKNDCNTLNNLTKYENHGKNSLVFYS